METGKAYSSRKMAINNIHNTRFGGEANTNRKRKVINNGSNNTKKLDKERKSIVRIETKGDEDKCCQVVALKKQDERNVRSVDGSEKAAVDGSKKDISHGQTHEIAGCEKKSETCVAKQKSDNSSNDALPLDKRTEAAAVNDKIAKHTTIVKTRVDGRERAMYQCGYCNKWKTSAALASNMLAHLQKHETGVLRCARCGHDAVNVPALEEHVARVHTRDARFVCALCGKACFSRKQLRQHEDIHNLHPRKCRHCGQTMRSLAQLKKHTKVARRLCVYSSCDVQLKGATFDVFAKSPEIVLIYLKLEYHYFKAS